MRTAFLGASCYNLLFQLGKNGSWVQGLVPKWHTESTKFKQVTNYREGTPLKLTSNRIKQKGTFYLILCNLERHHIILTSVIEKNNFLGKPKLKVTELDWKEFSTLWKIHSTYYKTWLTFCWLLKCVNTLSWCALPLLIIRYFCQVKL